MVSQVAAGRAPPDPCATGGCDPETERGGEVDPVGQVPDPVRVSPEGHQAEA
ncbi:hypothetical protein SGUI_0093 [Serinicoccus hydrothermalis]|uniref:Uncharacterized protein n=1 Tax=Serinicoccus hydrothermalis TaxID=1758689 RepID=A0A1B1N7T3_9MICO|nr:hypothetical protein SGUI_0093 [Serinicoccus hydrothermalis]